MTELYMVENQYPCVLKQSDGSPPSPKRKSIYYLVHPDGSLDQARVSSWPFSIIPQLFAFFPVETLGQSLHTSWPSWVIQSHDGFLFVSNQRGGSRGSKPSTSSISKKNMPFASGIQELERLLAQIWQKDSWMENPTLLMLRWEIPGFLHEK